MNATSTELVVIVFVVGFVAYWIKESGEGKPLKSIKSLPDIRFEVLYVDCEVVLIKPVFDTPERYYLKRYLFDGHISVGDKILLPCDESELVKC